MPSAYDALLVVSFGGPEGLDDVLPFLENVLCGKGVPRARMLEVAEHYRHFDGISPLNAQIRELLTALRAELEVHGPRLPVYWGNRNWHPMLPDTLQQMANDGIRRAVAFVTSAYSSYSSCRQYRENIEDARRAVGPKSPEIDKLRAFFNHPGFIEPIVESLSTALNSIPKERRRRAAILYTAHSIPLAMAQTSQYTAQLGEACRLVGELAGRPDGELVFQSRSGSPTQPWLEPDVCHRLRELTKSGISDAVVVPIGFLSDHMEVLYDLDTEARQLCRELGLHMVRAATVGVHPRFVRMIRELIVERVQDGPRLALGRLASSHDECPIDCCPAPDGTQRFGKHRG